MQSVGIFSKIIRFFVAFVVAVCLFCFESHADDCVLGTDGCAPEFTVTTTELSAGTTFSFNISAAGTYYIDWGDGGEIETIVKGTVSEQTITHTYTNAGQYTIGMSGQATLYYSLTSNSVAAISFKGNTNVSGISGSLGAIFGTLTDRVDSNGELLNEAQPRFYHTFDGCTALTGSIPENLFAGIKGKPTYTMFNYTFNNCSGLTGSIPENLFAGISGTPAAYMFLSTFYNCSGLTGSIPENLFAGIKGRPTRSLFASTFGGCKGLTGSIPENLFAGISGAPAAHMFNRTFFDCSGLTGSIPENLFAGISGKPAQSMFEGTFLSCSGLTGSIPENLFAGISGAPAYSMFSTTFWHCSGLTGSIPENLFAGIKGAPAYGMFWGTFWDCEGLTGSIPENLFAGISGAPADYMFYSTFSGCSSLSGSIPENLFAGISGAPAGEMFYGTFYGCRGLTGSIPENLFAGIKGAPAEGMFMSTFGYSGLTGYVPKNLFAGIDKTTTANNQMSSVFRSSGLSTSCPAGDYQYLTGFESYFDGRVACEVCPIDFPDSTFADNVTIDKCYTTCPEKADDPVVFGHKYYTIDGMGNTETCKYQSEVQEPEFTVTTTELVANTTFSFTISAAGTYYIDWGDGSSGELIEKESVDVQDISHIYANAGQYNIGIYGQATLYSTSSAISFKNNTNVSGISGSLGAIFGTLTDRVNSDGSLMSDAQPRFNSTFSGCVNLSSNIPENLFTGISGAPVSSMFAAIFENCSGLTGNIPENLFAGISGAPAAYMFTSTFDGCSGLTGSIPENLLAGISGAPTYQLFDSMFYGCSGLTGSIPENLFAGINGAPKTKMFYSTFYGCRGLTGSIPENLFAGIEGAPAESMFDGTFDGCYGLTGSIPENLFAGIKGAPARQMFDDTFSGCRGLTGSIPGNLFAGIKGAPQYQMFTDTFDGCRGLTGSIPENLFAGISGAPATNMFSGTFYNCSGLTGSIPENLFAGIKGAPASQMFGAIFLGCSGLTGSIPEKLFAGISGAPADWMFANTFYGCSGLTGSIPENLFSGISGAPQFDMFYGTFSGCSGLSGSIPENLFAGIFGAPAASMFMSTFYGCSGLTGSIPENLFAGISGAPQIQMFYRTFSGCSKLTGYVPKNLFAGIDKTTTVSNQMNNVFYNTGLATSCPASTYQYLTGFESYFNNRVSCEVCPANFPDSTSGDNATINKCYLPCEPIDGKIVTGGHNYYTEDGVGDATSCVYANGYTVTYHANGGIGEMPISEFVSGTTYNLPLNTFVRDGYTFIGWSTSPDGVVDYVDKASVVNLTDVAGGNVDLYAVWGQACTKVCAYNFACPANATCVNDINFTTDGLGNTSTCNAYDSVCPLTSMNCNFGYYDANPTAEKLAELSGYLMGAIETELTLILSCSVYGTDEVVEGNVLGLPDNGLNDCDFVVPGEIAIISVPADISEPWGMATMNAYSSYNADTPGALLLMGVLPYLSNANFSFEKLSDGDNLWLKLSKLYVPTVETEVIIEVLISEDFTQEMFEQLGNKLSQDTYNMFIEVMNNPDTAGLFKLLFNTLQPVQSDYDWLMYETGITAEMAQEELGFINYGAVLWFQFIAEGIADILPKTYGMPYCAKNQININWDLGYGENNTSTTTCSYTDVIEYPTDPVRPGYTFTGWKVVE